jgi:DNA end-binding protein Ku
MWSGAISFGLVSIPVKLYNAVSKKSVSFNQLDDRTMSRIRYRKVSDQTGEEVPEDHIVRGYEVTRGHYVVVDPDELEQFLPTNTHSIDLEEFVDLADIDPLFYDSAYYLAPDKVAKPYALLARAMEEAGKVGIGRFVMRNKEYVAAVRPVDGRLVLSTMVHADEVVSPANIDELQGVEDIDINAKELKMAEQLVESLAGKWEPERFHDSYREHVLDLIEKKAAGEELEVPEVAPTAPKVVDLMAALEASVKAAKEARGRHPSTNAEADDVDADEDDEAAEASGGGGSSGAKRGRASASKSASKSAKHATKAAPAKARTRKSA